MSARRKPTMPAAPVLSLATHREAARARLSCAQRLMLEELDKIRAEVLAGRIDGMAHYCVGGGVARYGGVAGSLGCIGAGAPDLIAAGALLKLAMIFANLGDLK